MRKVLFVTDKMVTGGIERVLVDLLGGLGPHDYEVTLLLPCPGGEMEAEVPRHVQVRYVYSTDIRSSMLGRLRHYARQTGGIGPLNRRATGNEEFDVVIAYKTSMIGHLAGLSGRKICFVHLSLDDVPHGPLSGLLRRHLRSMDSVVCVSEGVRRNVERFLGSAQRLVVLTNPVDEARIRRLAAQREPYLPEPQRFLIVSVGRLETVKRFDRLVEVARMLRDDGLDFEVWIVGDGSQREKLQEQIVSHGLEGNVRLLGRRANPYPYMSLAQLFVLTTSSEGYATVLTEALLLGVPVISTRVVGTDEPLAYGRYGRLVAEEPVALYRAVRDCMEYPDARRELANMASRATRELSGNRTWDGITSLMQS